MTDKPTPTPTDAERLAWMADSWTPGHEKLYAQHVLETGGVGDVDDQRTFIDKQIAAQKDTPSGAEIIMIDVESGASVRAGKGAVTLAGAVPLDEARRMFDAGWKAAALFCDREDVVADGIIGFGASPQFEAAFSAAHGIKGGQHGTDT